MFFSQLYLHLFETGTIMPVSNSYCGVSSGNLCEMATGIDNSQCDGIDSVMH